MTDVLLSSLLFQDRLTLEVSHCYSDKIVKHEQGLWLYSLSVNFGKGADEIQRAKSQEVKHGEILRVPLVKALHFYDCLMQERR